MRSWNSRPLWLNRLAGRWYSGFTIVSCRSSLPRQAFGNHDPRRDDKGSQSQTQTHQLSPDDMNPFVPSSTCHLESLHQCRINIFSRSNASSLEYGVSAAHVLKFEVGVIFFFSFSSLFSSFPAMWLDGGELNWGYSGFFHSDGSRFKRRTLNRLRCCFGTFIGSSLPKEVRCYFDQPLFTVSKRAKE